MSNFLKRSWVFVPILGALAIIVVLLLFAGADPLEALDAIINGAFGTQKKFLDTTAFWIPLLLASTGLLVTFAAGLWNIGIEGQIVMGAIAASAVALHVNAPQPVMILLEILAAMAGGALWAAIAAVLKTRGKVNEIFGGLALTNLAIILTNYLISGPWTPPEGGSFRGSEEFPGQSLLPLLLDSKFSILAFVLGVVAVGLVWYILSNTFWGLKLKALGKNPYSAFLLGVSSEKETILAMAFCGALAGLGGAVRVLSWFDKPSLRQSISGGIGYLALMVVMLAAFRVIVMPFIAYFFSAVLKGGISLEVNLQLDSSIGGILTGLMVLLVLLFGDRTKLFGQKQVEKTHE